MAVRHYPNQQVTAKPETKTNYLKLLGFLSLGVGLAYVFGGNKKTKKGMNAPNTDPVDIKHEVIEESNEYKTVEI